MTQLANVDIMSVSQHALLSSYRMAQLSHSTSEQILDVHVANGPESLEEHHQKVLQPHGTCEQGHRFKHRLCQQASPQPTELCFKFKSGFLFPNLHVFS